MSSSLPTALPRRVLDPLEAPTPAASVARTITTETAEFLEDIEWHLSTLSQSSDLTPALETAAMELLRSVHRSLELAQQLAMA